MLKHFDRIWRCNSDPIAETLKQLKTLIMDVGLFEALEKDFIYCYNIKTLLKKLYVPGAPVKVVDFLVTFGPFFDQIHTDFKRKQDTKTKMTPKATEISKAWNLAN